MTYTSAACGCGGKDTQTFFCPTNRTRLHVPASRNSLIVLFRIDHSSLRVLTVAATEITAPGCAAVFSNTC